MARVPIACMDVHTGGRVSRPVLYYTTFAWLCKDAFSEALFGLDLGARRVAAGALEACSLYTTTYDGAAMSSRMRHLPTPLLSSSAANIHAVDTCTLDEAGTNHDRSSIKPVEEPVSIRCKELHLKCFLLCLVGRS